MFKLKEIFTPIKNRSKTASEEVLAVSSTQGLISQNERFNKVIAGKSLEKYILVKKDDFTYNKGNSKDYTCGRICLVEKYEEGLVPNVYISFRLEDETKFDRIFLKYFFEADLMQKELLKIINLGVRNDGLLNLRPEHFFKCTIEIPNLEIQKKIAIACVEIDKKIEILDQLITSYKAQKQGLMHQLLTGKKRVRV